MVIQDYLSCINWSNESIVARATPSCWESFTPKQLFAKETFFTDESSPADVSMDTAITNMDSKETSVIHDTTWVAMGTPSPTDSDKKEIATTLVKEDVPVVTKATPTGFNQSQVSYCTIDDVIVEVCFSLQIKRFIPFHRLCYHHMILLV